jgi:4-amino-4-deoxy-L-arabinose transferase-like glycosyltransferase
MSTAMRRAPLAALLLIWLAVTAFNITKPAHIDDAVYLEIARHILHDPLHPMSGTVNWKDTAEPIHVLNQPPLLFYVYAAAMAVFGESLLALHGLMALCALAAIVFFYALACRLAAKRPLFLTALLALGPVFVPSQNLMTDVPMLALWLAALLPLFPDARRLRSAGDPPNAHEWPSVGKPVTSYLLSALFISLACLVKYTSLVLIPLLFLAILLDRRRRALWTVLVPLAALAAWSAWNLAEFGGVHLLGRPTPGLSVRTLLHRAAAWVIGLGAVSPFSVLLVPSVWRRRRWVLAVWALVSVLCFAWGVTRGGNTIGYALLRAAFCASGLLLLSVLLELRKTDLLLFAWVVLSALFVIVLSPFLAVRHYLVTLPALLLLVGRTALPAAEGRKMGSDPLMSFRQGLIPFPGPGRAWRYGALAATAVLGGLLGLSDWLYADAYRAAAAQLRARFPDARVWCLGHWGWQYYVQRERMQVYDAERSVLAPGDLVIVPELVHTQAMPERDRQRLERVDRFTAPNSTWTVFRTMAAKPRGGYYSFWLTSLPWTLSTQPLETFTVYEVRR